MREDLRGRRAPRHLQHFLTRRYGRTLHDEPRFRLIWAPSRWEQSAGIWTDWSLADATLDRESGRVRPWRQRVEMRWTRKYPGEECWLIEQWLPASAYGSPEQWYAPASAGGTVLWGGFSHGGLAACGPYPRRGDYEDLGARMHWYPSERHLSAAVDASLYQRSQSLAEPSARAVRRTFQAEQEQGRRDRAYDAFCREVLDDAGQAFGGAPMSGYGGQPRSSTVEMCERLGIRQHP